MREVVIVSGARTAVGAFGGSLKNISAVQLGTVVLKDVVKKAGLRPAVGANTIGMTPTALKTPEKIEIEHQADDWDTSLTPVEIDEVIMGNVLQAGQGQNPARQASIRAGFPKETPAFTVNKICGSGLKAIALATASIRAGDADVIVAGGQESMSNSPMALPKARWGHRMELSGFGEVQDLMVFDGLYEIFYGYHMGITAENIAAKYQVSRVEQDELAVLSHSRAVAATKNGLFTGEITKVEQKTRNGKIIIDYDERPMETDRDRMARLRPAFIKNGTVTAGNSSGINDGAAAVLLMSREKADELGLKPMVKITAYASGGLDPAYMGLGPVPAIRKILQRQRMKIADIDMIELNEAFASQAIGCMRELAIDIEKPNELGSGISLGHPIGATGARQMVTGIYQMQRKNYATGLISMCIGGGMGMAMLIEHI
jgi:acetyl-CoA C-acetyltransferase